MQNTEAEAALLGALINDNGAFAQIGDVVRADDFSVMENRMLFGAIAGMLRAGQPCDPVTLTDKLRGTDELRHLPSGYLMALVQDGYAVSQAPHYANIVREHADRRRLVAAAQQVIANAQTEDSEQLRSRLSGSLSAIEHHITGARSFAECIESAKVRMHTAAQRRASGGTIGVPTGIPALDRFVCGFGDGQVWVIAARPGTGKSAFLAQMAAHAATRGLPGLIVSLEMGGDEIAIRSIARFAQLDVGELFRGYRETVTSCIATANQLANLPLWIDTNTRTLDGIIARIQAMKARHGIKWAAIDHIGLIAQRGNISRNDHIGQITGAMKHLSLTTGLPIILISQMSRAAEKEDRKPMLSDLRDSGNVEQDADGVIFMHRSMQADKKHTRVEFGILKNRNGPAGLWLKEFIQFDGATQTFKEILLQVVSDRGTDL